MHKYINIAVLNYNTSYHTSIGSEPSRVFHRRFPYNVLDLKLGIRPQQPPLPTSQITQEFLEQIEMIHQDVRKNAKQAYIKYKAYYDKKANASKLKEAVYVYVLQPKADHHGNNFHLQKFVGLARTLSKKFYQKTIIWYGKMALTKHKCFPE